MHKPWSVIQAVLAELAAITAVLYYLGWIRAAETFRYFGVDVGILGLSSADYVLRSPPTAIPIIVVLNLLAVAAIELYRTGLGDRLATINRRRLRIALWSVTGVTSAAVVVLYVRYEDWGSRLGVGLPLLLTLAAGAAAGARHTPTPGRLTDALAGAALMVLAAIGLLWAFTLYGAQAGRQAARTFYDELPSRPAVTVYSDKLLVLPGATWTEATKTPADSAYQYRYQGLRLLARTPDGYLLLPERWRRGDAVYLVALGDGVRIDLAGRN
ncbi:hypothetical protein CryarDRAFT_0377 [Cryptosporangium arvum DSM 44712]|uniref:Uncharacterized protein n=1 Tax=Cryptosporangium arvum DSM 44712 TaxID=927661 RepID=A0A010ZQ69_9ACTN|nr:hypothetical protein CryarDRAFT_0377 [Cryptosporangium arvum DSM 44712]